jgi:hypothetical protein
VVGLGSARVSIALYGCKATHTDATSFTIWMAFGAVITKFWVPRPVDIWGRSRRLEDLGLGKVARKRMEKDERDAWREFVPGTPI